jgi:hypothetical protein
MTSFIEEREQDLESVGGEGKVVSRIEVGPHLRSSGQKESVEAGTESGGTLFRTVE